MKYEQRSCENKSALFILLIFHSKINKIRPYHLGVYENIDTRAYHDILFGNTVSILKNWISIYKKYKKSYKIHGSCFILSSYPIYRLQSSSLNLNSDRKSS